MKNLYDPIEPFDQDTLAVSPLHTIFYEQCGNPQGQPVVFLHGGPGGGIVEDYRRYFDPKAYRVILFDHARRLTGNLYQMILSKVLRTFLFIRRFRMATSPDNSSTKRILTVILTILAAVGAYFLVQYLMR
jgi:hypothetical protein